MLLDRVPQPSVRIKRVAVPAPYFGARDVSAFDQVCHDSLRRSLRDSHLLCDIPQPDLRVGGDREQNVTMICQERPAFHKSSVARDVFDKTRII